MHVCLFFLNLLLVCIALIVDYLTSSVPWIKTVFITVEFFSNACWGGWRETETETLSVCLVLHSVFLASALMLPIHHLFSRRSCVELVLIL